MEIRVLFGFDKKRTAILLLGGDKSKDWDKWYTTNIPIADDRFDEHQAQIEDREARSRKKRPRARKRS